MFSNIYSYFRPILEPITYNELVEQITTAVQLYQKSILDYITYSESIIRIRTIFKSITDLFTFDQTLKTVRTSLRSITDFVLYSDRYKRTTGFIRSVTSYLNFSEIVSHIRQVDIIISDFFKIEDIINWLIQFACSSMKSESACASNSCYWCSGTCQASTCSQQPVYGGGGGGGYRPPFNLTNVTPEIKTVLDTTVHVETPEVNAGDKVYATVSIMKVEGPKGVVNINLSYWIKDISGNIVGMKQSVVGIENVRGDIFYLTVPMGASAGTYTFGALAQYDNATDYAFDNFQVTVKPKKPIIVVKRVDVPFILANDNSTIKVVLENQENRKIDLNISLLLPHTFTPENVTRSFSLDPLSEDVIEFSFTPQESGSFTGFIRIEFEGNTVIKDFDIEVYATEKFINNMLKNYWWIIDICLLALVAFIVYKARSKIKSRKSEYVYKRKELLPKF
jgi:hypothetical protein